MIFASDRDLQHAAPAVPSELVMVVLCFCCAGAAAVDERIDVVWDRLCDVENESISIGDAKWKVICFLGTDCPLARLYGPRLRQFDEDFADQGVRLIGVNSNPQDSPADIKQYAQDHEISFPIMKDRDQTMARRFGATRTPEVFVLDRSNRIRYRGRIDDQHEPGITRSEPTQRHLRNALEALIAGRAAPEASTEAVGCLITFVREPRRSDGRSSAVTFTRHVAPILNEHCVECHRAGEIGPFALTDYDEVVGWSEMMLEVIEQKRMPPWHADPRYGKFVGARTLPEEARATLASWIAQGMPEGAPQDQPAPPRRVGGWHLSNPPDIEFSMRARPFEVPAEGTVEYQYFVVDPEWEQERWIRAAQVRPGNASVVHHAIVFVRPPDGSGSGGIGWLGGYVPGQRTSPLPAGHARRIPARSKFVFQMHYTPNGRPAEDVTKVGVWFRDPDEVTHEVTTRVALNHDFEIPPGAKDFPVVFRLHGFARDSRLLGAMPHMHLRGKSFRLDARSRDRNETLLFVPAYDFNWQHWYQFQTPLSLEEVDALEMQVRFDNSTRNPTNPAPEEYVTWGDQTWQEMAVAFFDIAHPRGQPRTVARETETTDAKEVEKRRRLIEAATDEFLSKLDSNGDGFVEREETPDAFRGFAFHRMDHDGDGRLERSEIEAEASQRF